MIETQKGHPALLARDLLSCYPRQKVTRLARATEINKINCTVDAMYVATVRNSEFKFRHSISIV